MTLTVVLVLTWLIQGGKSTRSLFLKLRWLGRQVEQADRLLAYISVNVPSVAQFKFTHGVA